MVLLGACQFDTAGSGASGEAATLGAASTSGEPGSETTTSLPPSDTSATPPEPETGASTTSEGPDESADSTVGDDTDPEGSTASGPGSTTESPEEFCGDAQLADNEDCDDGNLDELDGCTSLCRVGPTGIAQGQRTELEDRFGGYATGAFDTATECAEDERLVGLRGTFSYYAQYFVLARLRGICAPLNLLNQAPTAVEFGANTTLAELGTFSSADDTPFELLCPADAVVSGLEGFGGLYTDRVGLQCRTVALTSDASEFALGQRQSGPSFGAPGGGSVQEVSCPGTSLSAGFRVQGDAYATGIFLRCEETELTFSP